MELANHNILVTGGSAGIGLELARLLIQRGNRVAICGRNAQRLDEARAALGNVEVIECDLADPSAASTLIDRVVEQLGGLSVLVNNAGVQYNYDFAGAAADNPSLVSARAATEVQINFTSPAVLTATAMPHLVRAAAQLGEAAIVNVSSSLATTPKADAAVYCATKAALRSFTVATRYQIEDAGLPIHVVEVVPPLVDTAMTSGRGTGKVSPEQVARQTVSGMVNGRDVIRVGKARVLHLVNRVSPGTASRIMRNS